MGSWTKGSVQLPVIEFDGEQVSVSIKHRLLTVDAQSLERFVDRERGSLRFSDAMEVMKMAGELLPRYVDSFTGYSDSTGSPLTAAEFCEHASREFFFVPLVGQIFVSMLEVSTLGKAQEKTSALP